MGLIHRKTRSASFQSIKRSMSNVEECWMDVGGRKEVGVEDFRLGSGPQIF